MDCDKCENWKLKSVSQRHYAVNHCEDCENFKPKQHPLDEMIEGFLKEKPWSITDFRVEAKKLRYESIKWACSYAQHYSGGSSINKMLKLNGHEDWIVE